MFVGGGGTTRSTSGEINKQPTREKMKKRENDWTTLGINDGKEPHEKEFNIGGNCDLEKHLAKDGPLGQKQPEHSHPVRGKGKLNQKKKMGTKDTDKKKISC